MPTVYVEYNYFRYIYITNHKIYPNKIQNDCKKFCSLRRTATFEDFGELDFQHYDAAMEAVNITNNGKTIQVTMRYFSLIKTVHKSPWSHRDISVRLLFGLNSPFFFG